MKIRNQTTYPTKTLRAMMVETHRRLAKTEGRLRTWRHRLEVVVVYTRRRTTSGFAYYHGESARLRLARGGVDPAKVARLMEHEFLHLYGHRHAGFCTTEGYYSPEHLARFAWARERFGDVILETAPAARPGLEARRAKRLAHARKMLEAWTRREKIAHRRVAIWRVRVRRAEAVVSLRPAASPETGE